MATNSTSNGNPNSQSQSAQTSTPQPLSQKSEAQLKREARARLRHMDPGTASELIDDVFGKPVGGFVNFLREHAIIGLAVGFVLATQVQAVVKQLIASFIDPLFMLFAGGKTLSQRTVVWHLGSHQTTFGWGAFVYSLIDFIFVAVAIYAIVKIFNLDKLDKASM